MNTLNKRPITLEYWLSLDAKTHSQFYNVINDIESLSEPQKSGLSQIELDKIRMSLDIYIVQKLLIYEQRKENKLPRLTIEQSSSLYNAIRKMVSGQI